MIFDEDMSFSTRLRLLFVVVCAALIYQVISFVGTDWTDATSLRNIGNPFDDLSTRVKKECESIPGIRLMYTKENGFPVAELTIWDTVLGCTFYSLGFVGLLWAMTPMPDVKLHLFLIVTFDNRTPGPDNEVQVINVPLWHPAGGEGPVFNPPPPPPEP
ncbi:uncharacterized protein TNCT_297831 [Trichonephila clavata]|uniref:Uncharacterized protein n=1 Tax=Trichonephila clavata TaxID=2740835 RepID=A0A8X6IQE2_TRICU|nr:uncharacterized protein TNCT_297831 [Trichonephila clavata]